MDSVLVWSQAPGAGLLQRTDRGERAGLVALPGSSPGVADQPLFRHLSAAVAPVGVSVLSYDRRPPDRPGGDTGIATQAKDAVTAAHALRAELTEPVGYFGFSQGAWAAVEAAAHDTEAAFLVVVGSSGVSPAEQMRFYTDQLLLRHGFDQDARQELAHARILFEDSLRGTAEPGEFARLLDKVRHRDWFIHSYLPSRPPGPEATWDDMDRDPIPSMAAVRCPVLAIYGTDEDCVPPKESELAWHKAAAAAGNPAVFVHHLAGFGHWPFEGSGALEFDPYGPDVKASRTYTALIRAWIPKQGLSRRR